MVIDPTQINAMQQGSIGGIGIGMAGAYGQALPGYTGWQPFIPQGFFGGQLGQPLGMAMSPSIFATPQLGGQLTDYWGLLSNLLPYHPALFHTGSGYPDGQLMQQSFFGGQLGHPPGIAFNPGLFATPQLGGQFTDHWSFLSSLTPYHQALPHMAQGYIDGQHFLPPSFFGGQLGQGWGQLGRPMSGVNPVWPFHTIPYIPYITAGYPPYITTAGYPGGQHFLPPSFFGGQLGQLGRPMSGVNPIWPYQALSQTVPGYAAGQLTPQGFFGSLLGQAGGQFGRPVSGVSPVWPHQTLAQTAPAYPAGQPTPQGFFGNLLGQVGRPTSNVSPVWPYQALSQTAPGYAAGQPML